MSRASKGASMIVTKDMEIVLGGGHYLLTAKGITVTGKPTLDEHEQVGFFIKAWYKAAPIWLADWLRIGAERPDWRGDARLQHRLEEAEAATGLSQKRLKNIRAVGAMPADRRRPDVEFWVLEEVAGIGDPVAQVKLQELAATEGLNRGQLRNEIQALSRRKVLDGQIVMAGEYRVLDVDFPWKYRERHPSGTGAETHYPTEMSYAQGRQFMRERLAHHTTKNAVMGFWIPAPLVYDMDPSVGMPGPISIILECGFEPKYHRIWDKVDHVFGHYGSNRHELYFYCIKGSCTPDNPNPQPDSVVTERKRDREHSWKPDVFRQDLARQYEGPRVEMFARDRHEGYDVFGNDARLVEAAAG